MVAIAPAIESEGKRATLRRRRMRAIVDAAVDLAEAGGLDGVRLRDVAQRAGVSMGALYRCFESKEDILLCALSEDFSIMERHFATQPIVGACALDRVETFFRVATRGLVQRPNFARAALTATASGQRHAVQQVAVLNTRMANLIHAAITGTAISLGQADAGSHLSTSHGHGDAYAIARVFHRVWFSSLVGWAAGINTVEDLIDEMRTTAALLLRTAP